MAGAPGGIAGAESGPEDDTMTDSEENEHAGHRVTLVWTEGDALPREVPIRCPDCGQEMETRMWGKVVVDVCPQCDGVWFDIGEVAQHVEEDPKVDRPAPDEAELERWIVQYRDPCPGCGEHELRMGAVRGVWLQRCAACGGVFIMAFYLEELVKICSSSLSPHGRAPGEGWKEALVGFLLEGLIEAVGGLVAPL
jgi:Zn-finger nucleic acid-binding protein